VLVYCFDVDFYFLDEFGVVVCFDFFVVLLDLLVVWCLEVEFGVGYL